MKIIFKIFGVIFILLSILGFILKDFLKAFIWLVVGILLFKDILKLTSNKKSHEIKNDDSISKEIENDNVVSEESNNLSIDKTTYSPDSIKSEKLKNFTIIDVETTGLSVYYNEIVEIGAIKVRDFEIVDTYETLCNPLMDIKNEAIHGISNSDVAEYNYPIAYMNDLMSFIGDDTIFAYNAPFDIEFINSYLTSNIENNIVDVLALARAREDRWSYKLVDVRKDLNINTQCHRSVGDCEATLEYYKYMLYRYDIKRLQYTQVNSDLSSLRARKNSRYANHILENYVPDESSFQKQNYFFNKNVCFTGDFDNFSKADAYLKIVDIGGNIQKRVTLKTNILVVGNNNKKSTKEKKADEYNQRPDINIEKLYEEEFLKLIEA